MFFGGFLQSAPPFVLFSAGNQSDALVPQVASLSRLFSRSASVCRTGDGLSTAARLSSDPNTFRTSGEGGNMMDVLKLFSPSF